MASILTFLSMLARWMVGARKGLVRKLEEGIDLVYNKYNTTFLGVLADHMPLFYRI